MLLYKRVFQYKRLKFRVNNDDIEVLDLLDHRRDFWQMAASKVAGDTVLEFFCLTYIYDFAR